MGICYEKCGHNNGCRCELNKTKGCVSDAASPQQPECVPVVLNDLLSCDVADMIDRLTCMAAEKDMEALSPMQSGLIETHKADAKCLRKCISMIVALAR